jgi:hypothetical protein
VRNRSNLISGWILAFGLLAGAVALDPLAVYARPVDGQGLDRFWLTATAIMCAVSCVAYLLFAKPALLVEPSRLVIVNPFRTWTVPLSKIEKIDTSLPYPRVRAQGRGIFVAAMEESNLDLLRGGSGRVSDLAAVAEEQRSAPSAATARVQHRWIILDRALVVLLACWGSYAVAGVVRAWWFPWT